MNQAAIQREIRKKWKPRPPRSHKGDFGRVLILAGSRGMAGAAHLAAMAALRAGAGLVTLGVPEKIYSVLARREAEVMVRPFASTAAGSFSLRAVKPVLKFSKKQDVLAIGPGLSRNPETQKWVRRVLKETRLPAVVDADGLNALKGNLEILKFCKARTVLTPHPGEFQRLFGHVIASDCKERSNLGDCFVAPGGAPGNDTEGVRKAKASLIAKRFGIVVVLKGHSTVAAEPGGGIYVNPTGNPGMATAGTGDVLTGMIAALLGQGFSLWDSARFGVYLHGLAGDFAAKKTGEASLVAGDLLDFLPKAIKSVKGR